MTKCLGCGVLLQNTNPNKEGYVKDINNKLCERCFKIRHYNSYSMVEKDNNIYLDILNKISKSNDLLILVTDLFSLDSLEELNLKNPIILVLTKADLIPRNTDEEKLLSKLKYNLNIIAKIAVSSKNNHNLDELYNLINKYKKSKNVYVIGYTSSGKSTLINKIVYNYSQNYYEITTSVLPSTTLDLIEVPINDDLILIDTPGLLDKGSIILEATKEMFKTIIPKKEIKPVVIQIKTDQTIIASNIFRIDVKKGGSLVFYMSNNLKIERFYKENNKMKDLKKHHFDNINDEDIIIKGLGFIKTKNISSLDIYIKENIKITRRQSIMWLFFFLLCDNINNRVI